MKCWRGQTPKIMGLHNSITELHNSIYGAPLQNMQLYMNYGAPSQRIELHEWLCIKIELHGSPLCSSIGRLDTCVFLNFFLKVDTILVPIELSFNVHGLGWMFLNLLHAEVYADPAALILHD